MKLLKFRFDARKADFFGIGYIGYDEAANACTHGRAALGYGKIPLTANFSLVASEFDKEIVSLQMKFLAESGASLLKRDIEEVLKNELNEKNDLFRKSICENDKDGLRRLLHSTFAKPIRDNGHYVDESDLLVTIELSDTDPASLGSSGPASITTAPEENPVEYVDVQLRVALKKGMRVETLSKGMTVPVTFEEEQYLRIHFPNLKEKEKYVRGKVISVSTTDKNVSTVVLQLKPDLMAKSVLPKETLINIEMPGKRLERSEGMPAGLIIAGGLGLFVLVLAVFAFFLM